jgi:hypothetical protein
MEILERHHVRIDTFMALRPADTTFLVSHLHTDHAKIPKRFAYAVYASELAGVLSTHPALRPILRPGQWYRTHRFHVPFQVLATRHTLESIGFYFPTVCVLYMGDCTESIIPPVPRPLTVIYDGLYEAVDRPLPSLAQTCALVRQTLAICPRLQLVHHGILTFIADSCATRFRLHASVPPMVRQTATQLQMLDDASPYLLVGRNYTDERRIVLSSYWFMRDPERDPFVAHDCESLVRIFCTLHARAVDIRAWRAAAPYAHFETLVTNAV